MRGIITQSGQLSEVYDSVSKAALFDLVIDLVRRCEGDEDLDGPALALAIADAFEPIRIVRKDRMLRSGGQNLEIP